MLKKLHVIIQDVPQIIDRPRQWTYLTNLHKAPVPYPIMHHFLTKNAYMCIFLLQNGAL